jgi:hypothetical protein
MLDLFSAGKRLLMKGESSRVIGVVYTAKADAAALAPLFKAEGIELSALEKTDKGGLITLLAKDVDAHDAMLVKTGDSVALVVSGLRKSFSDYELTASPYTSERHVTSPSVATTIYKGVLDEITKSAENPAAYSAQMSKAATQFDAYMAKLGGSLPAQALKLERALKAGTGNANGGAGSNQETGDGLGDKANTAAAAKKLENGTGDGFEAGKDTGTTPAASTDDKANTAADAKPGERVSGSNSGLPDKANAKKADVEVAEAQLKVAKAELAVALAKAVTVDVTTKDPKGEGAAGEGAAAALDGRDQVSDEDVTGTSQNVGKVRGDTIDHSGIPAKVLAKKDEGDALDPEKLRERQLPDGQSGAGAAQRDAQTLKSDAPVMQAIAALSKAVKEGLDGVKKDVAAMNSRVDEVATMAKKTDAALHGTVFGEAGEDVVRQTRKADSDDKHIPLIDTGYSRRGAA